MSTNLRVTTRSSETCDHMPAVYEDHRWWRLFRTRMVLACWHCDEAWRERDSHDGDAQPDDLARHARQAVTE